MAEEAASHPSRYVKLTRDQDAPAEEIRAGELNQSVHVPRTSIHMPRIVNQGGSPRSERYYFQRSSSKVPDSN
ncbi:hypothetical protein ACP70R_013231 [Stipagrostis hirtigluma subsp. patula]